MYSFHAGRGNRVTRPPTFLRVAAIYLFALGLCGAVTSGGLPAAAGAPADSEAPKFANIILHNQADTSIVGLHRFVDGAKARGTLGRLHLTLILNGSEPTAMPGERDFFKGLCDAGHEIGVEWPRLRDPIAAWLGISPQAITTLGAQLFADADVEAQADAVRNGFRAGAHACVEGNSLAEFWDIPHNWEGAPMFPYWAQWDDAKPLETARVNREMDKSRAVLELQWASRTLWHNYDRFPIPQCWHFGEPLKKQSWSVGQLVHAGEKGGWWRAEMTQYENNLRAGRAPFLYLNTASEGNIFTPKGPWSAWLDSDEALSCALDLVDLFLERGWKLVSVSEFVRWYEQRWPCPAAPSEVFLMNDTLANRRDREGRTMEGHGRLLHAETKHYQICDHENRVMPEMIVAYDLRTPNLLRNGYTAASPAKWSEKESNTGHYASTTGNALFWSVTDPLKDMNGAPSYFPPVKPPVCRNRTFTFYLGDQWEPYQFAKTMFTDAVRQGDEVSWSKRMESPVPGTDIRLTVRHTLKGPIHTVQIEVHGAGAEGLPARLRLCPYFHQGWDPPYPEAINDSRIVDPRKAGQERNVFGQAGGKLFAYSESNLLPIRQTFSLRRAVAGRPLQMSMFNRNPGAAGGSYDDNPAMNRGFTLGIDQSKAQVQFDDKPGANPYVTAIVELGKHRRGATYTFSFRYWHGTPQ